MIWAVVFLMEVSKWIYLICIVVILVLAALCISWWGIIDGLLAVAPVLYVLLLYIITDKLTENFS